MRGGGRHRNAKMGDYTSLETERKIAGVEIERVAGRKAEDTPRREKERPRERKGRGT